MEYAEIKEWLDRHVRHFKEGNELEQFNSQISALTWDTKIQMFSGIKLVADIMGLDLVKTVRKRKDVEYPYKYSFVYDGVMFIQLSKERMV